MSSKYPSNNLVRRVRKPSFSIWFSISNLHPQRAQKLVDLDPVEKYFLTIYGLLPMLELPNIDRSQFPCAYRRLIRFEFRCSNRRSCSDKSRFGPSKPPDGSAPPYPSNLADSPGRKSAFQPRSSFQFTSNFATFSPRSSLPSDLGIASKQCHRKWWHSPRRGTERICYA